MMRVLRAALRGFGLALAGMLAAVVLLEITVRVLNLAPPAESPGWFWKSPDEQYGWQHMAGATGRWFNPYNEYNVEVTINSKGLRDEEIEYGKAADEFRILVLGDSYVEGLRVPLEQTFSKVLEQRLNTPDSPIVFRVINAGVSAWGADQALLWYRNEGVKYEPDLVVLGFFPGNDFMNNSEALEFENFGAIRKPFFHLDEEQLTLRYYPFDPAKLPTVAKPSSAQSTIASADESPSAAPLQSWRPWLHRFSAIYRFATPLLRDAAPPLARWTARWGLIEPGQEEIDATLAANYIPVAYGVYRRPPTEQWQDAFTLTNALLRALDKEVTASGGRLVVALLTAQEQVYPELWDGLLLRYPAMQDKDWDLEQPNRVLYGILDGRNIPYIDLLPVFRAFAADSRTLLHLRHDGHWTPTAERLAGEAIYEFLTQNHLAPAPGAAEDVATATPPPGQTGAQ